MADSVVGFVCVLGEDGEMQDSRSPSPAPSWLEPPAFLAELESAAQRFAQVLAEGDLEAPVPPCPDWRLFDLAEHLGGVHQWARHAVIEGVPDGASTPAPKHRDGLVQWYRDSAGALITTLAQTDPEAHAWSFGPKPRTAAFWFRRQAHETTMHLWDAEASQGKTTRIDAALALDGIDEVAEIFYPRQVRLGRVSASEHSLALVAADSTAASTPDSGLRLARWVLAGDGTGPASARDAPAQASVSGPAEALLLLLWRRTSVDDARLAVDGDQAVVRAVLDLALTP